MFSIASILSPVHSAVSHTISSAFFQKLRLQCLRQLRGGEKTQQRLVFGNGFVVRLSDCEIRVERNIVMQPTTCAQDVQEDDNLGITVGSKRIYDSMSTTST